jgi:S1-C subfamily serine protease
MNNTSTGTRHSAILSVALLLFPFTKAYALSPREIASASFPSVVLLVFEDSNGQPVSMGSGFVVAKGKVISNQHVVEGAARGYAKVIGQKQKYDVTGYEAIDYEKDLVLLTVDGCSAPPLKLSYGSELAVGDPVYAVGSPQGLEGTFSQGIVSGVRSIGTDSLLQITAPISPGSSGGPILNAEGLVVGVAVATFRGGQNLNFAIPSKYASQVLKAAKATQPLHASAPGKNRAPTLLDGLGASKAADGVVGSNFTFDSYTGDGSFSFSLVNKLREAVRDVYCLVVVYDRQESPLDVTVVKFSGLIPAGLAKRVAGQIDGSAEQLNTPPNGMPPRRPSGKMEIRVLDFTVVSPE